MSDINAPIDQEILTNYIYTLERMCKQYMHYMNKFEYKNASKNKEEFNILFTEMKVLIETKIDTNNILYKLLENRIVELNKIKTRGFLFLDYLNDETLKSDLNY